MMYDFEDEKLHVIRARLRRYREAENAILSAQSYELEGMRLTRADLETVQNMIAELEHEEMRLVREVTGTKRSRIRYVIPRDGFVR